jgi:Fructose-2,6-bisphosphatase
LTRIILVRHCEATGNFERTFQGSTDSDITENGKIQGEIVADRFKNIHYDYIYSSPLKRAFKTAQYVNKHHELEIIKDDGLIEVSGGHWEGMPWKEIPNLFPEEAYNWAHKPWDFHPQGGESMKQVYDRIWETILKIVKKHQNKTICIASHGGVIRNFLCRVLTGSIKNLNEIDWCDNTGINIIDFDDEFKPIMIVKNDASHLNKDTSTLQKQTWWKKINTDYMSFE